VEIGSTETVLDEAEHPYTKALLSVVPEVQRLEPIVLQGETPDPTKIPSGCRFNPRCPALASGEAAAAGIAHDCVTRPLGKLTAERVHQVACFLPGAQVTRHTELVN
jgi:peptide/nickel transport system ATP-binding protein